jgi:cyclase
MSENGRNCARALLAVSVLAGFVLFGAGRPVCAQENQNSGQQGQTAGPGKVEMLHVQGNVYMIAGAGANITVQVGTQFVIVVDSGLAQMSDEVLAAIRSVTDKHILFVIDTSADADHTSGNGNLSKAGWALPNSSLNPLDSGGKGGLSLPSGASIIAHINVLNRMSEPAGKEPAIPSALWPSDTYETRYWRLYNSEGVFMYHPPNAHTDGDTYVLFRKSDVVSTGGIFDMTTYPVIRADQGGNINGLIDALNQIIELLEPEDNEEGGTYVVPAHGRICDRNDIVNYRDMATIIRGRIQALIKKGMTIDQVKAAKPTLDYDGLYGSATGPWTTDMFIEAVYQQLSQGKAPQDQKAGAAQ